MLNIVVTVKQVLDPEAPASTFKIDPRTERVVPAQGVPPVLNPYDENALEAALRIKDFSHSRITVISSGAKLAKPVLRKSLAAGADELVLLEDDAFGDLDSYGTALILAAAIRRIGSFDLILAGRLAADTLAGQVGSGIAEILDIPSVTLARRVDISQDRVRVERVLPDGYEIVEVPLPALVTVSHECGQLRNVALGELRAAKDKPTTILSLKHLGMESLPTGKTRTIKLFTPLKQARCEIIEGKNEEEAGIGLALRLRNAKVI